MTNPFNGKIEPKPEIRPMFNVGGLLDIPTGEWSRGKHGEMILNGGKPHVLGIGGRGNMYKSVLAHHYEIVCMSRYPEHYNVMVYDTENTVNESRFMALSKGPNLDLAETIKQYPSKLLITDSTMLWGDQVFDEVKALYKERIKQKNHDIETPLIDKNGVTMKLYNPIGVEIDSFSKFRTLSVSNVTDKASIGASERNTEAMRDGGVKTQLLNELVNIAPASSMYVTMTAHLGDKIVMDQYAPPNKQLAHFKGDVKFKNVPEGFTFLTHVCWLTLSLKTLKNPTTKAPEYPRDKRDTIRGEKDLEELTIGTVRNKFGATGAVVKLIVSQSEGILTTLSEFHNCKENDRFGMGGNMQNYYMELYPDCSLSRTKVREKINSDPRLRRAINITSEIQQMKQMMYNIPTHLFRPMDEIYKIIKEKGYDWDVLLDSRGYWVPDQYNNPVPYLSSYDILDMADGTYHPYWYDDYIKQHAKAA